MTDARIGISGWRYAPWRGTFYPENLRQDDELAYAARRLRTIEINGSFYSLEPAASWQAWHDAVPEDFVFAVKGGRYLTHIRRLRDVAAPLANFFASGLLALRGKLGPVLWQLPPFQKFDAPTLAAFFQLLPRSTREAAALGAKHDHRLKHPFLDVDADRPIRHTLEVRHDTFLTPDFPALLREHRIALCVADNAKGWPILEDVTADFVYVRLHGHTKMYASGYSAPSLDRWAQKVRAWNAAGRDAYVYFDNDSKIRAPYDALNLAARLGQGGRVVFPRGHAAKGEEPRGPQEWRVRGPRKAPATAGGRRRAPAARSSTIRPATRP